MGTNAGDGALKTGKVTAIVGGQYGGEGKGSLISHLAKDYDVHVRSNVCGNLHESAHNKKIVQTRYIPTGWRNPKAELIIGPGAVFDPVELKKEIDSVRSVYPNIINRLYIDFRATVYDSKSISVTRAIKDRFTGYMGNGVCRAMDMGGLNSNVFSTEKILDEYISTGKKILLEGHSGTGKSILYGNWPYNLHNFDSAQLFSDCGVSMKTVSDIILVAKVYPSNTGDSDPTIWERDIIDTSIILNKPTTLAINYLDKAFVVDTNKTDYLDLSDKAKSFLAGINKLHKVDVRYIGTGFDDKHGAYVIDRLKCKSRGTHGKTKQG